MKRMCTEVTYGQAVKKLRRYIFKLYQGSLLPSLWTCLVGYFEQALQNGVLQSMCKSTYETITKRDYVAPSCTLYSWDSKSTYINEPPYFKNMTSNPPGLREVKDAYCLLKLGDDTTTDHISPAGIILKDSPAAEFLIDRYSVSDFNSYGSRRGNHEVMTRGTFADIRIVNKLLNGEVGPKTVHVPTGEELCVFDAATLSPILLQTSKT